MTAGDRVLILSGRNKGLEAIVMSAIGSRVKCRIGAAHDVIDLKKLQLQPIREPSVMAEQFQGRRWEAWVPPVLHLRKGALDAQQCPSIMGDRVQLPRGIR
jgi:hypothetical protein